MITAEVRRLHPNLGPKVGFDKDPKLEGSGVDSDPKNILIKDEVYVPAFILKKRKYFKGEIEVLLNENFDEQFLFNKIKRSQGINLNVQSMEKVIAVSDLVKNLDLKVEFLIPLNTIFDENFENDITYNFIEKERFRKYIMNYRGRLKQAKNYVKLNDEFSAKYYETVILSNSRVLLQWKGVNLSSVCQERILSLGLLYLIDAITKAELVYNISLELPKNVQLEILTRKEQNRYVLISISDPVFSF